MLQKWEDWTRIVEVVCLYVYKLYMDVYMTIILYLELHIISANVPECQLPKPSYFLSK